MVEYVVGFAFTADKQHVALIQKARPTWQRGKLNGIGGHVEDGESWAQAQAREFAEETGVDIHPSKWVAFATLNGAGYLVRCFYAFDDAVRNILSITDEPVSLYRVADLPNLPAIPNLQYLIPLALDEEHIGVPLFSYGKR